jgi:hypothetical protein
MRLCVLCVGQASCLPVLAFDLSSVAHLLAKMFNVLLNSPFKPAPHSGTIFPNE